MQAQVDCVQQSNLSELSSPNQIAELLKYTKRQLSSKHSPKFSYKEQLFCDYRIRLQTEIVILKMCSRKEVCKCQRAFHSAR